MKKLLFSALVLSLAFTSCKKDDDGDGDGGQACTTCTVQAQSIEICEGANGNAFVAGVDSTIDYNTYITGLGDACN